MNLVCFTGSSSVGYVDIDDIADVVFFDNENRAYLTSATNGPRTIEFPNEEERARFLRFLNGNTQQTFKTK